MSETPSGGGGGQAPPPRDRANRELLAQLLRSRAAGVEAPLSYNQRSLWIIDRLAPESTAYSVPYAWRVIGPLDTAALRGAFERLVARHAILRTTYAASEPIQRVHESQPPDFEVVDAAAWTDEQLRERMDDEVHRPFDLVRGPVLRVRVFEGAPDGAVLLVIFHHIAYDLWSLVTFLNELGALYTEARTGTPTLPPLAHQYVDFVRWQAEMLAADGERLWAYWRERLKGELPVLSLPTDRVRPPVQTYTGACYSRPLPPELAAALQALARREETTLFTVLVAAFAVLLAQVSGQRDVVVGTPMVGRTRPEFEGVLGYFLNSVPLRFDVAGDRPFGSYLREAHAVTRGALEHQDNPFELLIERLRPARDPSRSVLFQSMFVLSRPHLREGQAVAVSAAADERVRTALGDLTLEAFVFDQRISQFDVSLNVDYVAGNLRAHWEYNTDLFDEPTIAAWAEHYERLLAIAARFDARLADLPRPLVAPRTAAEEAVADVFAEMLGGVEPGAFGHFFDLGGDDAAAAQAIQRLNKVYGVAIAPSALAEAPRVNELARLLEEGLLASVEEAGEPSGGGRQGRASVGLTKATPDEDFLR
jgi:hypothetical protein